MADGVKIEIVSPERLVLSEQARSVVVPGADGYFTVTFWLGFQTGFYSVSYKID